MMLSANTFNLIWKSRGNLVHLLEIHGDLPRRSLSLPVSDGERRVAFLGKLALIVPMQDDVHIRAPDAYQSDNRLLGSPYGIHCSDMGFSRRRQVM